MPKNQSQPDFDPKACVFRMAVIDRAGVDRENRSFPIVLATETPVRVYDWRNDRIMDEVLHVDGIELPRQVPLLNTHNRYDTSAVLGSIRDFKVIGGELHARAFFASKPAAVETFNDYAEGHMTDFSVSVRTEESDVTYEGNTRHVNRSRLLEGSAVSIGADPNAKAMLALRAYTDPEHVRSEVMYEKLRELLVQRGLKKDATDSEVLEFAAGQLERADASEKERKDLGDVLRSLAKEPEKQTSAPPVDDPLKTERARVSEITDICRQHAGIVTDAERDKWLSEGTAVEAVTREVLKRMTPSSEATRGRIEGGVSEREKFYLAARDAFIQRAVASAGLSPVRGEENAKKMGDMDALQRSAALKQVFDKPAAGHERFKFVGPSELARMFLEQAGEFFEGMSKTEIAQRAIALGNFVTVKRSVEGPAYHTTGSFPNLMLDAINKTLLAAYDEAEVTYTRWVRQAASAPDFKTLHRIRLGELPDPKLVGENKEYEEATTSDQKVSYGVEKYGQIFSITLEAIINDDMDALSRIPAMQGTAMRRKVNKACYAVLTGNQFPDGTAIFSSANDNGANNAIDVTNLNTAFAKMMTKPGLTAGTVLNIRPRFIVVPAALSATAWQVTNSTANPAAGGSAAGNSNTANIYGPNGTRSLEIVEEGQLDGSSSAIWYLIADNRQVDTVEITFLQGEESPVMQREEAFKRDAVLYKIRQTFKAAAIDYRGMYRGGTTVS